MSIVEDVESWPRIYVGSEMRPGARWLLLMLAVRGKDNTRTRTDLNRPWRLLNSTHQLSERVINGDGGAGPSWASHFLVPNYYGKN